MLQEKGFLSVSLKIQLDELIPRKPGYLGYSSNTSAKRSIKTIKVRLRTLLLRNRQNEGSKPMLLFGSLSWLRNTLPGSLQYSENIHIPSILYKNLGESIDTPLP